MDVGAGSPRDRDKGSKRYSVNLLEEEAPIGTGHTLRD
jgi:hypothetical protein